MKETRLGARLSAENMRSLDALPGKNRTEKLSNLIEQRGVIAALLDEQRALLAQVQKTAAHLSLELAQLRASTYQKTTAQTGAIQPADLAAIFQALALVSNAIGKPAMNTEAANFCASKMREIATRQREF